MIPDLPHHCLYYFCTYAGNPRLRNDHGSTADLLVAKQRCVFIQIFFWMCIDISRGECCFISHPAAEAQRGAILSRCIPSDCHAESEIREGGIPPDTEPPNATYNRGSE
ncbi:hypothetical protein L914_12760 [Phytophthora nicotianae]|uniref:Uncharacterized protein n=1 Tax=Phytophthora nicotianae TaxID=4792 RepID=W2N190_PHYNI|nr:hypothetical protein L914_12760 [Phytophthora nicotianae]